MERLTFYGMFCNLAMCQEVPCKYPDTGCSQRQVWERLKNIEDILCDNFDTYDLSRIKELVEADREGRCVVMPCKIGETIYHIHGKTILPMQAKWVETNEKGWCVCGNYPPMATFAFSFDDFGKTVFLTREAAEKALEGRDG